MNVMNAVSLVVDSLDSPAKLVGELQRLGQSHGRHSIEQVHFHVSTHRTRSCGPVIDLHNVALEFDHRFGGVPRRHTGRRDLHGRRQTELDQSARCRCECRGHRTRWPTVKTTGFLLKRRSHHLSASTKKNKLNS